MMYEEERGLEQSQGRFSPNVTSSKETKHMVQDTFAPDTAGFKNNTELAIPTPSSRGIKCTFHSLLNPIIAPGFRFVLSSIIPREGQRDLQEFTEYQRKNVQEAIELYNKFILRLEKMNTNGFVGLLADVLKATEKEVQLDDFFQLLYTIPVSSSVRIISATKNSLHQSSALEARLKGLALCRLIHDTFMNPPSAATHLEVDSGKLPFAMVNAHEFHRTFLATKILLHCVKPVEDAGGKPATLIKTTIFNIYQVYCFTLFRKNAAHIDAASSPEHLMLGQSSLGKLMKVLFPSAKSKRLGKRGFSKYHFTGVTWRESAMDGDIRRLIDLEPSQVKLHFRNTIPPTNLVAPNPRHQLPEHCDIKTANSPHALSTSGPLLSYVTSSSKFPAVDFSPRVRRVIAGRVPQQSQWFREIMLRSVNALKYYNVNLEDLIQAFQVGEFSEELGRRLRSAVYCAENEINGAFPSEDTYEHVHIIVLTVCLPVMLASDEEIPPTAKSLLRASLKSCVRELEEKEPRQSPFERNHRRMLLTNVRKLVNIGETVLVTLPRDLATDILQVIMGDLGGFQQEALFPGDGNGLDHVCRKAAITMLNAHPHCFPTDEQKKITLINQMVETFNGMCVDSNAKLQLMLADIQLNNSNFNVENLRFEIFKLFMETFHSWLLQRPFLLEIPIPVLRFYFSQIDMEIQSFKFKTFGELSPQLATETFKTWWLMVSAFHEYLAILSEVVALSQRVSGG